MYIPAEKVFDNVDVVEHGGSVQRRLVLEVLQVDGCVVLKKHIPCQTLVTAKHRSLSAENAF